MSSSVGLEQVCESIFCRTFLAPPGRPRWWSKTNPIGAETRSVSRCRPRDTWSCPSISLVGGDTGRNAANRLVPVGQSHLENTKCSSRTAQSGVTVGKICSLQPTREYLRWFFKHNAGHCFRHAHPLSPAQQGEFEA